LTLYHKNSPHQRGSRSSQSASTASPIFSSQPYGGISQPSSAPVHFSPSLDSGPAPPPLPPLGGFFQHPDYTQHSGVSHPGGATYPTGFVLQALQGAPPDLRQDEYVWFPLHFPLTYLPGELSLGLSARTKMVMGSYPMTNYVCALLSKLRSDSGLILIIAIQVALF